MPKANGKMKLYGVSENPETGIRHYAGMLVFGLIRCKRCKALIREGMRVDVIAPYGANYSGERVLCPKCALETLRIMQTKLGLVFFLRESRQEYITVQ